MPGHRAAADRHRPAGPHLGPPADPAVVLAHTGSTSYESMTRALCDELIDGFIDTGTRRRRAGLRPADPGAGDLVDARRARRARPTRSPAGCATCSSSATSPSAAVPAWNAIAAFFFEAVEQRKREPGDDLISDLLQAEVDGAPVPDVHVLGTLALILIAGVDTTWSGIGSAMWHLADARRRPPAPGRRARADPDRHRGAAAGLLAGDDGPHRRRGHRARRVPDERRRQGAAQLPGRQPRPRGVRPGRRGRHRPRPSTATSRSASASTAAPAPTWPAWSCGRRRGVAARGSPSSASPTAPRSPGPAARCGARAACPSSSDARPAQPDVSMTQNRLPSGSASTMKSGSGG